SVRVVESARGQGAGVLLYRTAIQWAEARGLTFASDQAVSRNAQRVYEALARRGYEVRRNPAAASDAGGELVASEPVFVVRSPAAGRVPDPAPAGIEVNLPGAGWVRINALGRLTPRRAEDLARGTVAANDLDAADAWGIASEERLRALGGRDAAAWR